MRPRNIVLLSFGIWIGLAALLYAIFGSDGKNDSFQPQEEFRLEPWIKLEIAGIDMSINRAVFYLILAAALQPRSGSSAAMKTGNAHARTRRSRVRKMRSPTEGPDVLKAWLDIP